MAQQHAPPPPPLPPELIDDAIGEILLRIPPDSSSYLVRASIVCKQWRRILSDPDFTRRYGQFHRTPPLVGWLDNSNYGCVRFATMPSSCPFRQSAVDCSRCFTLDDRELWALDCRHSRVLLQRKGSGTNVKTLQVCDPITGGREELPMPYTPYVSCHSYAAMVLCAVAGCDHRDCHGGPFLIVFVGTMHRTATSVHGWMYSSEARAWSTPVSVNVGSNHYLPKKRGALIDGDAYFTLHKFVSWTGDQHGNFRNVIRILKYSYDLGKKLLSVIDIDRPLNICCRNDAIVMPMEDGSLGFADIRNSSLFLWQRIVVLKEVAQWVPCRVIHLAKLLPANISSGHAQVIGFAEGVGVVFVRIGSRSIFMIELKSERGRKVGKFESFCCNVLPFMSFCTPGSTSSILPSPVEKH